MHFQFHLRSSGDCFFFNKICSVIEKFQFLKMAEVEEKNKFSTYNTKKLTVEEISDSLKIFGKADYAVFITMLVCCSMVGLYFGFDNHRKQKSSKNSRRGSEALNYLMGGRNMQVFPVAMSLVASFISGITLLGMEKSFLRFMI